MKDSRLAHWTVNLMSRHERLLSNGRTPEASIPLGRLSFQQAAELQRLGETGPSTYFRDGNRLLLWGSDETKYEAHLAGDVRLAEFWSGSWRTNVFGTVVVRLRMSDAPSSPIRTPSFMPKATMQFVKLRQYRSRRSEHIVNVVPVGHHSNGQDGCPLENQVRSVDECEPGIEFDMANPEINRDDGSFSTNYSQIGYSYRWTVTRDGEPLHEITVGTILEQHLSLSDDLWRRYGVTRLLGSIGYAREYDGVLGRMELRYRLQRIFGIDTSIIGVDDDPKRLVHILEGSLSFQKWPHWSLFGRYYNGRDYYNINFEQEITRAEFGVAFSWEAFGRTALTDVVTR